MDNKDFKMVPMKDSKGNPVLDGKGKPVMTKRYLTKAEKSAATTPAKAPSKAKPSTKRSAPAAKPKRDIVAMAEDAIDRSAPTRPKARPGTTRPKARSGPGPNAKTATSVSTPEVTTSKLPPRGSGSSSKKPFAGTKPTPEEWENMSVAQRVRWGVVFPPRGTKISEVPDGTAARRNLSSGNSNKGGGSGSGGAGRGASGAWNKGGMVKANCGASMKPTQKGTRKK